MSAAKAELFYWLTIMFSQTLGTALGDWTADRAGLGYVGGVVLFIVLQALIVAAYIWTNISRTALFWMAFMLTRPLGAVLGDFLDKPLSAGGLRSADTRLPQSCWPDRRLYRRLPATGCAKRALTDGIQGADMNSWILFALMSAAAAGATAVLAKIGVQGVPSNLATAVRTAVVLVFAWGIVVARGELAGLRELKGRTLLFLLLSGIATGLSWLATSRHCSWHRRRGWRRSTS